MARIFGDVDFRFRRTADKWGPRRLLVLDMGSVATKAVIVARQHPVVRWEAAALLPAVGDDLAFPGGSDLATELRNAHLVAEYVSLVVSGRTATVRLLNFPGAPGAADDRRKQVLQALGLDDSYAVVHEVVSQSNAEGRQEYGVLSASMPSADVGRLREFGETAELKPVSLMVAGVASTNLIQSNPALLPEDGAVGFLEVGAATSVLLVFSGRELALARQLKMGLSMMLEALRSATQLDMDTAVKLFHSGSFDFSANIAPTVKPWLHQIGISLDFFERRYGRTVGALNLFGGGARSKVLEGIISERVRCPVVQWNAVDGLGGLTPPAACQDNAGLFALAAGEALRIMCVGGAHAV